MHSSSVKWLVSCFLAASATAFGTTVNFTGTFGQDDDVQFFQYTVQNTGVVSVTTTSWAQGGFLPVLSLFLSDGTFSNSATTSTSDCIDFGVDSATGTCFDTQLTWNSVAGDSYFVALTQYDNLPTGDLTGSYPFALPLPFFEYGQGNFTAQSPFNSPVPGGSFLAPGNVQRDNSWALNFQAADPGLIASELPEPATPLLCLGGLALLALRSRRSKRTAALRS
jgi:uncharacterized protein (TIGR03382 family)